MISLVAAVVLEFSMVDSGRSRDSGCQDVKYWETFAWSREVSAQELPLAVFRSVALSMSQVCNAEVVNMTPDMETPS